MRPNAALLRRTLEHIKANRSKWSQALWRRPTDCGTVACFAGWAAELAGGEWIGDGDYLVPVPEDDPRDARHGAIFVRDRATRLLGLTAGEAEDLFNANNNLRYIEQAVEELCAKAEAAEGQDEEDQIRRALHEAVDHIEPKGRS